MNQIRIERLACGMPVVVERIPGVRSVGLSWLVPAGSARDPEARRGLSALWSEMLLRGAGSLDSREQANAFDRLGVSRGTGVESYTLSVSATLLGRRVPEALGLITSMVREPRFEQASLDASRDLCLQAIESLNDDPHERVFVLLRDRHAPVPVNRSSLGTVEGLQGATLGELEEGWRARAVPGGSVLALAGDVDADEVVDRMNELLGGFTGEVSDVPRGEDPARGYHHVEDATNQVHIGLAHDGPGERDEGCWVERVVTAVLSGGMSCRLFTEVREKRSLCYSVFASYGTEADFGRTVAYAGTTPERAQETLNVLRGELERINTSAGVVEQSEFDRAVVGLKSRLVMTGESTSARAGALARDYRKLGEARSLDTLASKIDGVTLDRVNAYLSERSLGAMTALTIGPEALEW